MSWRTIVVSKSAKLDYQLGFLVVRTDVITKVHIDEIETLILESTAISITGAVLSELVKKKVKVLFCDEKRNPISELVPYYGAHDSSGKIRNQICWSDDVKKSVWTEIVVEKIKKQSEHLKFRNKEEYSLLDQYSKEIEYGDATNREGHAAKVYFNALFGKSFTRSEDNAINAALNYGYTLILSSFNREVTACGYITQLGIFHDNMFNHFNLSSDIMEPFRIMVDRTVFDMHPDKFEHDEKMLLLEILQETVFIAGREEYLSNAIKIYTKSVLDALNDNDTSLIKFYNYEL